jgi:hypothetical protein
MRAREVARSRLRAGEVAVVEHRINEPIARHGVQHATDELIERRLTPRGLAP